jgi:translin
MSSLDEISDSIRSELENENEVRDRAIAQSRVLIRQCANTIRAIHRQQWKDAPALLQEVQDAATAMSNMLADYPALYHAGYTQDALKEYVEVFVLYAIVRDEALPTPQSLNVPASTYANGAAEAASELRRHILDIIRHGGKHDEAERMLDVMDEIYTVLMTIDFPDAITGGLRRRTDALRGVLERTRGDFTISRRQQSLQDALQNLSERLNLED